MLQPNPLASGSRTTKKRLSLDCAKAVGAGRYVSSLRFKFEITYHPRTNRYMAVAQEQLRRVKTCSNHSPLSKVLKIRAETVK